MKYFLIMLLATTLVFLGCQQTQPTIQGSIQSDSLHYFSIPSFIQSQIMDVDLHNYQIQVTQTFKGKRNTSIIDKDKFGLLANEFYRPLFEVTRFEQNFTEQIFQDESTRSIILHYQAKNNQSIPFVDILLDADTHLVKRLFFREYLESDSGNMTKQYSWKNNREFQINSNSQSLNGDSSIKYLHVNWTPTK